MTKVADVKIICGSGGVGKTTVSAALGLKLAKSGKKVIVLTVDPAKRLATSLGIKALGDVPQKIDIGRASGELWAMMLDTKRTFDRLVERYAQTEEARQKIFGNKLYQQLSAMLAGTQEYMAMERLHEVFSEGKYDAIVVDTPPMQNAVDFLAAPERMRRMISHSVLKLLLKPGLSLGKAGLKFFEAGARKVLSALDKVAGFDFLSEISEMVLAFSELLGGFESRAEEVQALLTSKACHFQIVVTTQRHALEEATEFSRELKKNKYELGGVICNRVYAHRNKDWKAQDGDLAGLKEFFSEKDARVLVDNYQNYKPLITRDKKSIKAIQDNISESNLAVVPLFLTDVHDLGGLEEIGKYLQI